MKRKIIIMMALIPTLVMAQQLSSNFELGVGGGYSSLGYEAGESVPNGTVKGGFSPTAHVGYAFYFCEWVGLGVGVDWTMYSGSVGLGSHTEQTWSGVTDTDGERYDHHLEIDNWKEKHTLHRLEIPLSLRIQGPGDGLRFVGEVGAKWGMPLGATYKGSGTLTHYGYYEWGNVTLRDEPNHGYYTESGYQPTGRIEGLKKNWSVFAKAGVAVPIKGWLDLTIQAYGQYSLGPAGEAGGNMVSGFRNDRAGMEDAHYFMEPYSTMLTTPAVTGKVRPWDVGVEIGLRYVLMHRERSCYPCMIMSM